MEQECQKIKQKLTEFLFSRVEFAYVFGSVAKGRMHAESDIDVAVYLKNPLSPEQQIDFRGEIGDLFDRPVDVVFLNECDLIIAMQVLATGVLIVSHSHRLPIEYQALKLSQYIDFKISRRGLEKNLMRGKIYD